VRIRALCVLVNVMSCGEARYRVPDYAAASSRETQLVVGDRWPLRAVMTCPAKPGRYPAVVLVPGSGPVDRDGARAGAGGPRRPFRDLALGLVARGVCVVRYDNRLATHRERVMREVESWTLQHSTIDDAVAAAAVARARPEIDASAVFVLGHSLGGRALPRIAASDGAACGFVSMAGTPRALEDAFAPQARRFANADGELTDAERAAIAEIEAAVRRVKELQPGSKADRKLLPGRLPVAFWLDLATRSVPELLRAERRPFLVLHGERDLNVGLEDFAAWRDVLREHPTATFKSYPALDHQFLPPGGRNVAQVVVDDIAAWIRQQPCDRRPRRQRPSPSSTARAAAWRRKIPHRGRSAPGLRPCS
jgi:dienelactone hydrolase